MATNDKGFGRFIIFFGLLAIIVGLVMSFWPAQTVASAPVQVDSVFGRVYEDSNKNGQLELGEQGIQGVVVQLFDSEDRLADSAVTFADGWYSFVHWDSLSDGMYFVETDQRTHPDAVPTVTLPIQVVKEAEVTGDIEVNIGFLLLKQRVFLPFASK